jgi:hypothetical protein
MSGLYPDKLPATSKNFNPKYAEYNPGLYAAINAGQPSPEDAFQMAEIQYLQAKHAELNNMKNINAARKQFSELAPAIKENINFERFIILINDKINNKIFFKNIKIKF